MFGAKWPILFLCFLTTCANDIEMGEGPEYPEGVVASFARRDFGQLETLSGLWSNELSDSTKKLQESLPERRVQSQAFQELSSKQNQNEVDWIGPDREASEWEVSTWTRRVDSLFMG